MPDPSLTDRIGSLWIFHHPFEVLGDALPKVSSPASAEEVESLEKRYRRIRRRGEVAVRARGVLLVLFYFSAVVTLVGGVGGIVGRFQFVDAVYRTAFAASAGFSALFGLSAMVLGRYLSILENRLVLLAVRLQGAASSRGEGSA